MHQSHVSAFSKQAGVTNKEIDNIILDVQIFSKDDHDHDHDNKSGQHHTDPPLESDSVPDLNPDTALMSEQLIQASISENLVPVINPQHVSLDQGNTQHDPKTVSEPHLLLSSLDEVNTEVQGDREGSVELIIQETPCSKEGKEVDSQASKGTERKEASAHVSQEKGKNTGAKPRGVWKPSIKKGPPPSKNKGSEPVAQAPSVKKQVVGKIDSGGTKNGSPVTIAPGIEVLGAIKEEDVNISQVPGEFNDWIPNADEPINCKDFMDKSELHDVKYNYVAKGNHNSNRYGELTSEKMSTKAGMAIVTEAETEYSLSSDDDSL